MFVKCQLVVDVTFYNTICCFDDFSSGPCADFEIRFYGCGFEYIISLENHHWRFDGNLNMKSNLLKQSFFENSNGMMNNVAGSIVNFEKIAQCNDILQYGSLVFF